jgi:FkbM family methyltransferase
MTFISYSQNLEDVMLWRALKHIEQGFYVDVGANDPTFLSVTHAFYERGWHGINIDPATGALLERERPRDVNLEVAAGATGGEITFYEISDSALSTSDSQLAERYRQSGHTVIKRTVPSMTLNQILEKYSEGPIHFMNIDVEGTEMDVLRGLDLTAWRPWILLIEATIPTTETPAFEESDSLITSSNYQFVYFDGLNRFYVAKERQELLAAFSSPPNLFDDYVLCREVDKQQDLEAKEKVIQAQNRELDAKEKAIQAQNRELKAREEIIQRFQTSYLFWISDGPFRWIPGVRRIVNRLQSFQSNS